MKTVFITGAAQGIGQATARAFAAEGWFVGLSDINEKGLAVFAAELGEEKCCYCRCDVTDRQSVTEAIAYFSQRTQGRMDVLVNNAGLLYAGAFEEINAASHDLLIAVNIKGLTTVCQQAFSILKQTPNATVVNISSVSSVHAIPHLAVYSASKYYVSGLTAALNIEWQEHGIRVLAIKPPVVKTAMGESLPEHMNRRMASEMTPQYVARAIFDATQGGNRVNYLSGYKAKLFALVCKYLPEAGQRALTQWLSGHAQRNVSI